jgi:hypothetical protein
MYVQVRALENRVPMAAPNVCGNNILYRGKRKGSTQINRLVDTFARYGVMTRSA